MPDNGIAEQRFLIPQTTGRDVFYDRPSLGKVVGEVEVTTEKEIVAVVGKARKTLLIWAEIKISERCKVLSSFVEISKKRAEEIAQLIAKETGRPIKSARTNVSGGIDYFEAYIKMAEEYLSPKVTFESDTEIHRVYREPRGVIAAILPWNYPFMRMKKKRRG